MDRWTSVSSMQDRSNAGRCRAERAAVRGILYAVGGYDGATRQCLSTVEAYNPKNNTWSYIAEMGTRRSGAGVGVLKGLLYAVGGHDGPLVRKSCEVYDPATNSWRAGGGHEHVSAQRRCLRRQQPAVRGGRRRRQLQPGLRGVLQPSVRQVDAAAHLHEHRAQLCRYVCSAAPPPVLNPVFRVFSHVSYHFHYSLCISVFFYSRFILESRFIFNLVSSPDAF
ncbi:unnamed protein product [Tetraodon nigroviridis]|uniref:(spotted green pufferfish) hypothetical protein n=1 Tax=Tetraodon nigroviridis TaxID=99883 RepID=Q4TH40_TETNG|nr:unnamed protein product [Tetraodon nigroviridis]